MRCREVDAPRVGEQQLLHTEVGDAEHQDVVELACLGVDGILPLRPVQAERPAVHEVGRSTVGADLLRRVRQRERELVEVGHRRHQPDVS